MMTRSSSSRLAVLGFASPAQMMRTGSHAANCALVRCVDERNAQHISSGRDAWMRTAPSVLIAAAAADWPANASLFSDRHDVSIDGLRAEHLDTIGRLKIARTANPCELSRQSSFRGVAS